MYEFSTRLKNPHEFARVKTVERAREIKIANYCDGPRVQPGNKIGIYTTRGF